MAEIKRIDANSGSFMANGVKYLIQIDALTIERYRHYERIGVEMGYGVSYQGVFESLSEAYKALTTGSDLLGGFEKAKNTLYNQMAAIKDQGDTRTPAQVMFCTLFCNAENEDLTTWSEDLAQRKINDWSVEGIAVIDFFLLATTFLIGFQASLTAFDDLLKKAAEMTIPKADMPLTKADTPTDQ